MKRRQGKWPPKRQRQDGFREAEHGERENGERRIGGKPVLFPLSRLEAVDIDEEEDFLLAEALAREALRRKHQGA